MFFFRSKVFALTSGPHPLSNSVVRFDQLLQELSGADQWNRVFHTSFCLVVRLSLIVNRELLRNIMQTLCNSLREYLISRAVVTDYRQIATFCVTLLSTPFLLLVFFADIWLVRARRKSGDGCFVGDGDSCSFKLAANYGRACYLRCVRSVTDARLADCDYILHRSCCESDCPIGHA